MYFQYDTNGTPLGFIYNGTQYLYLTDQMGDVIAITDADGGIIAAYVYDAWGKLLNINYLDEENSEHNKIVNANPLRYRGYYYDNETGYYYLQSRYYDPSICRFINADIFCSTDNKTICDNNMFAYCDNNPTNKVDFIGTFPVHIVAGVAMGIVWSVLPRVISDICSRRMSRISNYLCDAAIGAIAGLITSLTGNSTLGSIIGTFVGETIRFLINYGPTLKKSTVKQVLIAFIPVVVKTILAGISDRIAGKLISKITKKRFTTKQTRNYFRNTKYLKSAFGIGKNGKTGKRVWFREAGLTTILNNFMTKTIGI